MSWSTPSSAPRMLARCALPSPARVAYKRPEPTRRAASGALHFYSNKQLELYASKDAKRLSLRQLVRVR